MSKKRNICRVRKHPSHSVRDGQKVYKLDGGPETVCDYEDWGFTEEAARRIAACWNACDGISTEALENITLVGDTLASRFQAREDSEDRVSAQRDELLAALIEARRWIGDGECSDGLAREYWTPEYAKAVDGIDATIAKAKGSIT